MPRDFYLPPLSSSDIMVRWGRVGGSDLDSGFDLCPALIKFVIKTRNRSLT